MKDTTVVYLLLKWQLDSQIKSNILIRKNPFKTSFEFDKKINNANYLDQLRGAVEQWVNALPLLGCNAKGWGIESQSFFFFYNSFIV